MSKSVIGIDEAGRGPLAGPVSVGAFRAEEKMGKWILKNIFDNKLRDSKKLSPDKREEIYNKICLLKKENKISFSVLHISNKIIDKRGIIYAINSAIKKLLFKYPASQTIRLDGSLKAPGEFLHQRTIIKGDEKDIFIACASIVAKVSRDRLMCRLAKKHPKYGFELHKGYGTQAHRSAIGKYGLSDLHRTSFCCSKV